MSFLKHFNELDMFVGAFRYYLGRTSGASYYFARSLAKAWEDIPKHTQDILIRELKDAFERDDEARKEGKEILPLGDDIDRLAWEAVRRVYSGS